MLQSAYSGNVCHGEHRPRVTAAVMVEAHRALGAEGTLDLVEKGSVWWASCRR